MHTAIVQTRMGSSRLPGKALRPISGKPILGHIIERLKKVKGISAVCVATSVDKGDDAIEEYCRTIKMACYRGSENDLLDRFYQAALMMKAQHIVRIWGDCVLIDPAIIELVIKRYDEDHLDFCSNGHPASFPRGNDLEVFSFTALETAWREAKDQFYREYMSDFIWRNPDRFKTGNVSQDKDLSSMNWCVDYPEDLAFATKVIEHFGKRLFHMEDVLRFIAEQPELATMNKGLTRYADYEAAKKAVFGR
jgi:spore coat polysaccharide biosynthesis protein SpsF (cytidylyltransferase family)